MPRGKIIVFEGADGAGKSTQVDMITKHLHDQGFETSYIHFPNYDSPFGKLIKDILFGKISSPTGPISSVKIEPHVFASLYILDRHLKKDFINQEVEAGKIIIADRYSTSNEIFQSVKFDDPADQDKFITWLRTVEHDKMEFPRPDLVVFLNVPVDTAQRMIAKRGNADLNEKDIEYQRRIVAKGSELAHKETNWKEVLCADEQGNMKSPEQIHAQVREYVAQLVEKQAVSV